MIGIVKVSEKGQIAIPKDIRDASNIKQGDELLVYAKDGTIFLEKAGDVLGEWKEDLSDFKELGLRTLKKVWDNEADAKLTTDLIAEAGRHRGGRLPLHQPHRRKAKAGTRHLKR